jgi:hypothetical protein
MKCKVLFVLLVICNSCLIAQTNVGIGTATPSEKLDVNGNINVQGTIKANGVAGQNNQVLMTNPGGNLVWADLVQYKNFVGFTLPGPYSWNVPVGITKILIEAWAGGGTGGPNGGGGGGGYIQAIFLVTPGQMISINVGAGGTPASGGAGGHSSVIGTYEAYAYGGNPSFGQPGFGGQFAASVASYFGFWGEAGHISSDKYEQSDVSSFVKSTYYGNGGNGANTNNTAGRGEFRSVNASNSAFIKSYSGIGGMAPGGGGGGTYSGGAYGGGNGMVIIRY